jgi:hypothetical protein
MGIFTKPSREIQTDAPLSQAEALNIPAPSLTREHAAGLEMNAELGRKETERFAQIAAGREARLAAHKAAEDAIWQKIVERQRHVVGG